MERITFQMILDSLSMEKITQISLDINIWVVLINLIVAFVLVMFIFFVYRKTFTGVLYSKNFNITLVIVSMVTTSAVIVISSNIILALGMVGALSIVRFRMAVKDPKDVGFLFWAITNGIICGVSAYSLALISVIFIGLIVFLLSRKIRILEPYLLILNIKDMETRRIENILKRFTINYKLRSKIIEDEEIQTIIELKIKKDRVSLLLGELKELDEIIYTKLVSYEGDLEEG